MSSKVVLPYYSTTLSSPIFDDLGQSLISYNPSQGFLSDSDLTIPFLDLSSMSGDEAVRLLLAMDRVLAAPAAASSELSDLASRVREFLYLYELAGPIATEFSAGQVCAFQLAGAALDCDPYIFSAVMAGLLGSNKIGWETVQVSASGRVMALDNSEVRRRLVQMLTRNLDGTYSHLPLSVSTVNEDLKKQMQSVRRVLEFVGG